MTKLASPSAVKNLSSKRSKKGKSIPHFSEEEFRNHAAMFEMMGHQVRLHVTCLLMSRDMSVGELCDQVDINQPAMSHHLAIMRHSGIVQSYRDGKMNIYSLRSDVVTQVMRALFSTHFEKKIQPEEEAES